ncbi:MAG: M1 family metallopeptidase [Sphingobacteriales bacterium]|nr:M1 family metallopeptidase [Sphingobacteriales bacterium]
MKKSLLIVTFILISIISAFSQTIHQNIKCRVNVNEKSLFVEDEIILPVSYINNDNYLTFSLNKNFSLIHEKIELGYDISQIKTDDKLTYYRISFNDSAVNGQYQVLLKYQGKVEGAITPGTSEYARGFSETDGIISREGVYLAGSTAWVPDFQAELFSFQLTASIDSAYTVVSQGRLISENIQEDTRVMVFDSPEPQDEIYLVARKWIIYRQNYNGISVEAFLAKPDPDLAKKYMDATKEYLTLYHHLIAPYPYSKFTLVENFWETGYGMPSFTLLGEKVIRFPWIISSSYPHELLHNYWGNSVYVDYSTGNWCEGITSYMADHLFKEQKGEGEEYRRSTLQKYADFVNPENDFPLSQFKSRNNPVEEAIGYGKCLMMNHMLRREYGDEVFLRAYSKFFNDNRFKRASFNDIKTSFEEITRDDLDFFFDQWVNRTGAPAFSLKDVVVSREGEYFVLYFKLDQVQTEEVFKMNVPVAVWLEGDTTVTMKNVISDRRSVQVKWNFTKRPLKISVDPQFDVFRLVDKREVPPSLSRMYGATKILLVVPVSDPKAYEYELLAKQWQENFRKEGKVADILYDKNLLTNIDYQAIWIFGYGNQFCFYNQFADKFKNLLDSATLAKWELDKAKNELIFVYPHPDKPYQTFAFVGMHDFTATQSLTNKLPHYGKYSYLGFEGKIATNNLKGVFEVLDSPLSYIMKYQTPTPLPTARLPKRKALTDN